MNINNPTTFGSPSLTLSTSNSSGTGGALRSDDTIALFDATAVASVGASNTTGSQAVASRRDHVHAGFQGAGTVVDDAISRFNGTTGGIIQGYSSLPPTISDAGIISLTSGALKFPATAIASADANTLDDFQEGSWSPGLSDDSSDSGTSQGQSYHAVTGGQYVKIGSQVFIAGRLLLTSIGSLTEVQDAKLTGLPFTINSSYYSALSCGNGTGLAITAGNAATVMLQGTLTYGNIGKWSATTGTSAMTVAEVSADGGLIFQGSYPV